MKHFAGAACLRLPAIIGLLLLGGNNSFAFENAEHNYVSGLALTAAATDGPAPDIAKYQNLTLSWTYGINLLGTLCGKPAEQLAHIQDQSQSFSYTGAIDGGDFNTIRQNILDQYELFNFSNPTPTPDLKEGAYVWLGAAMHLIEDQASLPHAANVWHSTPDNFEGPLSLAQILSCPFGGTSGKTGGSLLRSPYASVGADQAYSNSLKASQALIFSGAVQCPLSSTQTTQCYLFNNQFATGESQYDGSAGEQAAFANGQVTYDPQWYGDYGGPLLASPSQAYPTTYRQDIYSDAALPGVFNAQGSQAADFAYFFLMNISKSLPPLIQNFQTSTQNLGAQTPMTLSFHGMENRTETVISSVTIWNSAGTQMLLNPDGTPVKAFIDQNIDLGPLPNGPNLPWEKDVTLCCPLQDATFSS